MMIVLGLIIAVIILAVNNSNLKNQLNEYKKILIDHGLLREDNPPNYNQNNTNVVREEKKYTLDTLPLKSRESNNISAPKERVVIKEKPKYSDKEIKNSSILIVGSILVVLSALIFLTTTWNVTNNIFKTFLLFVMLFVFYGASIIAKKINLKQTYKAFHYITLAYIPITLLSLCVFKLIGPYFSIGCEGSSLYLSICSFIVCAIYYFDSKRSDSKFIGIMSFLFLLNAILFLNDQNSSNMETYLCSFLCVGSLLTVMHRFKKFYINEDITKISIYILMFGLLFINFLYGIISYAFDSIIFLEIINTLLVVHLVYYSAYISNTMEVFKATYPILAVFTFFIISGLTDIVFLRELIVLLSFVLVSAYEVYKYKKISNPAYYELLGCSFLLYCFTFIKNSIPSYIVLLTFLGISLLFYINDDNKPTYKTYFISVLTYLFVASFFGYYELNVLFTGYITLFIIVSSMLFDSKLFKSFRYVGYAFMLILTATFEIHNILSILLLTLYTIALLVNSIYKRDMLTRIGAYAYLNITGLFLVAFLDLSVSDYFLVIPICNIFVFMLELLLKNRNINVNKIVMYCYYGVSSIILMALNDKLLHLSLIILLTALFYTYAFVNDEKKWYKYIPYAVAIPFIYYSEYAMISGFNVMKVVSIISLTAFICLLYYTRDKKYTIYYYIYLLFHASMFEDNKYVILVLFAVCSLLNYIIREGKLKDFYKALLYTSGLIFTQFIVYDASLSDISVCVFGPYMIYAILITRDIFKKYMSSYKVFEYIALVLINLLEIAYYTSEVDGLIFVAFLVICVIFSYIKKYGPVFLTSLIFIIINVLILTKEFWLNLPWWLYILLIGSVLIIFAVSNELKDKKNSENTLAKIKDDLDL